MFQPRPDTNSAFDLDKQDRWNRSQINELSATNSSSIYQQVRMTSFSFFLANLLLALLALVLFFVFFTRMMAAMAGAAATSTV